MQNLSAAERLALLSPTGQSSAVTPVGPSGEPLVTEWLEPPYSAGHWVPDMVAVAGGTDVAGMSGEPSHRMRWPDVAKLEPDVVILAPCGFDLDRTLAEIVPLAEGGYVRLCVDGPVLDAGRLDHVPAHA